MAEPRITVAIPVRNGMPRLGELLSALAGQRASHEVVAIDSDVLERLTEPLLITNKR